MHDVDLDAVHDPDRIPAPTPWANPRVILVAMVGPGAETLGRLHGCELGAAVVATTRLYVPVALHRVRRCNEGITERGGV